MNTRTLFGMPPRLLHVRRINSGLTRAGVWRRIILATTLAACAGLAHTALGGQISQQTELTETMMQAQAYDAFFLDMVDPFTSLSAMSSIDLSANSFSYSLEPSQTIKGTPVSDFGTGSGDFTSGLYEWDSALTAGNNTYDSTYCATWDPGTAAVNGLIYSKIKGVRWKISGNATLTDDDHDSGTVNVQAQTFSTADKKWFPYGPSFNGTITSVYDDWDDVWDVTVSHSEYNIKVTSKGTWETLPEPGCFDLLWTGAAWAGAAWVASMLRAHRSEKARGSVLGSC